LSSLGGQTLNPYDVRHSPGGSSGGTAAAVAASFATLRIAPVTGLDLMARIPMLRVNNYELRFAFDAYLERRGPVSPVRSLADLIATGKSNKTPRCVHLRLRSPTISRHGRPNTGQCLRGGANRTDYLDRQLAAGGVAPCQLRRRLHHGAVFGAE
jgi:hypothetical protein